VKARAKSQLEFGCLGIRVVVRAEGIEAIRALGRLAEDFEHFTPDETTGKPDADETIEVFLCSPRENISSSLPRLFSTPSCVVRGWGPLRDCVYSDGVLLRSRRERGAERFEILGDRASPMHETAWEAVLSALGEALDRRGAHRVHALGIEWGGRGGLIIMPSGGGKSTLAALLSASRNGLAGRLRILSDETPLVYRGRLWPFPVRMALAPSVARTWLGLQGRPFPRRLFPAKQLFALELSRIGRPVKPEFVILGSSDRAPRATIRPIARWFVFEQVFDCMAVGLGVAQMREHMIRLDNLGSLARIFVSRVIAAARLAFGTRAYRLTCSTDPARTLEALLSFLSEDDTIRVHGRERDRDLPQTGLGADQGQFEEPLPENLRGVPLGGAEPDRDVRGAGPGVPPVPPDPGR
jgi:hypothetical protein